MKRPDLVAIKSIQDIKQHVEDFMLSKIPILQSMRAKVLELTDREFSIKAPLDPNKNHLMSAFGGSIAALATAAGWAFVVAELKKLEITANVVVVKSSIKYLHPIQHDFVACCQKGNLLQWSGFMDKLVVTSHSKIKLCVNVICNEKVCAVLEGTFLARVGSKPE